SKSGRDWVSDGGARCLSAHQWEWHGFDPVLGALMPRISMPGTIFRGTTYASVFLIKTVTNSYKTPCPLVGRIHVRWIKRKGIRIFGGRYRLTVCTPIHSFVERVVRP